MASTTTANSFLQSPNAIPPRTSSTGQHSTTNPTASSIQDRANQPVKSALRPLPEANWITGHNSTAPITGRPRKSSLPTHSRTQSRTHSREPSLPPQSSAFPRGFDGHASTSFKMTSRPPTPPDPARYATEDLNFFSSHRNTWSVEKEKVLCGPFDYLVGHKGKEFRSQLISAFNTWLDVPRESLEVITRVIGMLHTASLLVDDIEDYSELRRGIPVAHDLFGIPQTINSANYIYFLALQELQRLKNQKALTIFSEELINLHRGQGMDLYWRDTLTCPTEDDYLEMVGNKTGGLFRLGIKLMQAESRSLIDCVPLVNIVGLIFQIQDDYRNLWSQDYTDQKGLCEDLTEGKFSFPVIHCIRSKPDNLELINILKLKTDKPAVKRYAVDIMDNAGSFEYTRKVLQVLHERARKTIDEIDASRGGEKNEGIHKILDKLVVS